MTEITEITEIVVYNEAEDYSAKASNMLDDEGYYDYQLPTGRSLTADDHGTIPEIHIRYKESEVRILSAKNVVVDKYDVVVNKYDNDNERRRTQVVLQDKIEKLKCSITEISEMFHRMTCYTKTKWQNEGRII